MPVWLFHRFLGPFKLASDFSSPEILQHLLIMSFIWAASVSSALCWYLCLHEWFICPPCPLCFKDQDYLRLFCIPCSTCHVMDTITCWMNKFLASRFIYTSSSALSMFLNCFIFADPFSLQGKKLGGKSKERRKLLFVELLLCTRHNAGLLSLLTSFHPPNNHKWQVIIILILQSRKLRHTACKS